MQTTQYTCCRDGNTHISIKSPTTTQKRKGRATRKLGLDNYCLSSMTAHECMESGKVVVKYVMTHTNHHNCLAECKHLPLPKSVTKKVQSLLASGVHIDHVLDGKQFSINHCMKSCFVGVFVLDLNPDIRGNLNSRSTRSNFLQTAMRRHFITRQDCRNIGRKLENFRRQRHADDAVSVDRLVRELSLESPSPVLAYKPQGMHNSKYTLPDDAFFLAIMTEFQAKLFEEYSDKIVCLDSTHNTNQYRHKLVTLMIADEFRRGMLFRQLVIMCAMISITKTCYAIFPKDTQLHGSSPTAKMKEH